MRPTAGLAAPRGYELHPKPVSQAVAQAGPALEEAANAAPPDGERGDVLEAVLALPEQYRAPVHLFYYEDLPVEEIAKILGLREGAVRTRLSRARGMLRDMLKEDEEHA